MRNVRPSSVAFVLCCACMILVFSGAQAASRIKLNSKFSEVKIAEGMVLPARDDTMTIWLDKERARRDDPTSQSIIYDRKTNLLYVLYHKFKIYSIRTLNGTEVTDTTINPNNMFSEGMAQLSKPSLQTTVAAVDSTQQIRGRLCRKYILSQSTSVATMVAVSTTEVWATSEIKIDMDLYDVIRMAMMVMPGALSDEYSAEMKKIKGVAVLMNTHISGNATEYAATSIKGTEELIDFCEMEPPAGYFDIPSDYEWYRGDGTE